MSFVYKRGRRWYVGYIDAAGEQRRESSSARTKAEAEDIAKSEEAKAERVRRGLERPQQRDLTFREAGESFVGSRPSDFASLSSFKGRLKRINEHLGKKTLRTITPADVKAMLKANEDVAPQTREHLRVAVQAVFTYCIEDLRRDELKNPAAGFKVPIPKRQPVYLEREDLARLFEEISETWRPAFMFALGTAVRKGELLALRKADVNLAGRCVVVSRSHNRDTTKAGKDRIIPIPLWLIPTVEKQMRTKGPLLFPNHQGEQWSRHVKLHDRVKRALKRAGLGDRPFRWKDLRSSWATHAAAMTGDIRFVQKILGHGDIKVTDRYAFALPTHMQSQANAVDLGSPLGVSNREKQLIAATVSKHVEREDKEPPADAKSSDAKPE